MLATWGSSSGINALLASSSLSLNFSNGSYTLGGVPYAVASVPGYSFTRSSGGYAQNVDGSLTYFASGTPRITNKGYLSEEARTNNILWSEDFTNAAWDATQLVTVAGNTATSPSGTTTADSLIEAAGTGTHHIHDLVGPLTPAIGTSYTMTGYVKQPASGNIGRYVQLAFWIAGFGATAYMNYDIQAGVVGIGGAGITASSITSVGNGWYRISATAVATAIGASGWQLAFVTSTTAARTEIYTVTAGNEKTVYIWGAQLETGAFGTSYIPTTTAAATRAADVLKITGNFMGSGPWTWLTDVAIASRTISGAPTPGNFYLNSSNYLTIYCSDGTAGMINLNGKVAGTDLFNVQFSGLFARSSAKIGMALIGGNVYESINGSASTSLGTNTVFSPTQTSIGYSGTGNQINGYVRGMTIWNTQFSTAQLQAITT